MKTSNLYAIDWRDAAHGLLVAVGSAVIIAIQNSLSAGSLMFNWKVIGMTASAAGLSYLAKKFFTPATTVITPAV